MEFSRQEYRSAIPFSRGSSWSREASLVPDPGKHPASLVYPALAGGFFSTAPPGKPCDRTSVLIREDTRESASSPHHVRTQWEGGRLGNQGEGPHQELNEPAAWSWTSSLQKRERIKVCCLGLPVYGILLRQPKLTNTPRHSKTWGQWVVSKMSYIVWPKILCHRTM